MTTLMVTVPKDDQKTYFYPEGRECDREQGGVEWKTEMENTVKLSYANILAHIQTSGYLGESSRRTRFWHQADKR